MSDKSAPDDKRPLGFVNRRGHNTDVSAKDLEELSIDTQPELPPSAGDKKKPAKSGKTKKQKVKVRRHAKWTRKRTMILVAVILAVLAIPIVIGEALRAQYVASASSAQASLKSIVTHDVLPLQKKSEISSKQVSSVTDKLEEVRDDMCPGGLLDNMAMVYPRSREAYQQCIDERGKIASLVTQMRDMVSMLSYLESVNAALAPVSAAPTDAFAVIATQQSSWQQVSERLQRLSAPALLKVANDQLVTAVKSITDGWSKLNVANNAQNAADFQAAEKQLSDGYTAVRVSKDAFATAIAAKQATISQLSQDLY